MSLLCDFLVYNSKYVYLGLSIRFNTSVHSANLFIDKNIIIINGLYYFIIISAVNKICVA